MALDKKVISPNKKERKNIVENKTSLPDNTQKLTVSFSKFKLKPICINKEFNNHFKDKEHFVEVSSGFISTILPEITSNTYNDICEGSEKGKQIHFHTIDAKHRDIVNQILKNYGFDKNDIDQMFEGNSIFECSATLGHNNPARVVFHKIDNILEILFFDTNHHIYMQEKYIGETLFYEDCPVYNSGDCKYMPYDCFAVGYLDENKLEQSYENGYFG